MQKMNERLQEINYIYSKCIERASIHVVGNRYMIRDLVNANNHTQVCDIHYQENSGYTSEQIVDKKLMNCLATTIPDTNVTITLKNAMFVFLVTRLDGPIDETLFVNASICTAEYEPTNKPIVIDLVEINGKINAMYVEE
jgi:hypothetical protein